jgi:histidinol-phosphate aminotransferase
LSLLPRPELIDVVPATHGGPEYSEIKSLGLSSGLILDFSVCCNPYPPPRIVMNSLKKIKINSYPDSQSNELRSNLAKKLGVSSDNILAGNGTTELIRLIALAYFNKGDRVLIPGPTYGEYEIASRISGAKIVKFQWKGLENGSLNIADMIDLIRRDRPRAIFLCNPNNPTGHYLGLEQIKNIISNPGDTLLILDEAYVNFVEGAWSSLPLLKDDRVIILRSMTKDYGLAGLRLGYALAAKDVISVLRRVCPPWNVNIAAQRVGIAALESEDFLQQSRRRILKAKQFLISELGQMGFKSLPSRTNFFLLKAGCGKSFRKALLEQGLMVRDCESFGLPDYVRIAPGTMVDCRKLVKLIKILKLEGKLDDEY